MRSIQRIRHSASRAGVMSAALLAACSSTVAGSDPMPEPSALTVEQREDKHPILAAVDGDGRAFSTYWHGTDDLGYRMIITLENPSTGERGQLRIAAIQETGVTEVSTTGDFGEGTWSDAGLPEGTEPPANIIGNYKEWLDFWSAAAQDPANAQHLQPPPPDVAVQDAMCVGVCNTIKGASCNFKDWRGTLLCNLVGLFVCDGFCNYVPSELSCFVTEDGGCVRETCCQQFYGCYTYDISGCPY